MSLQFYFGRVGYEGQPPNEMGQSCGEFDSHKSAASHALSLSKELGLPIAMHAAGKKEYHYYNADMGTKAVCKDCRHWRDKAWTSKGWGKCDNPKNEVKSGPLAMIRYYLKEDPKGAEELARAVEDGILYPEDFGCIFFEPPTTPPLP